MVTGARADLRDSIRYYDSAQAGLGRRFKLEVEQSAHRLAAHPELCGIRSDGFRRFNLKTFSYYLPYVVRGGTLWLLAVAHNRREPHYWMSRLDNLDSDN